MIEGLPVVSDAHVVVWLLIRQVVATALFNADRFYRVMSPEGPEEAARAFKNVAQAWLTQRRSVSRLYGYLLAGQVGACKHLCRRHRCLAIDIAAPRTHVRSHLLLAFPRVIPCAPCIPLCSQDPTSWTLEVPWRTCFWWSLQGCSAEDTSSISCSDPDVSRSFIVMLQLLFLGVLWKVTGDLSAPAVAALSGAAVDTYQMHKRLNRQANASANTDRDRLQ